ncbi:hypothetical protein D6920_08820 [Escherichia coli]|nr:hypothetical protein [Escherichia coli]KAA9237905.1 hypothetical protein F6I43_18730 [Escherichia coli]
MKNAVIERSPSMKIRIFHTVHYRVRITDNESYQTLVAIFYHRRKALFSARAVLAEELIRIMSMIITGQRTMWHQLCLEILQQSEDRRPGLLNKFSFHRRITLSAKP